MSKDDARPARRVGAANDNGADAVTADADTAVVEAALTRIAEAIGRHIARAHIRASEAANDNDPPGK